MPSSHRARPRRWLPFLAVPVALSGCLAFAFALTRSAVRGQEATKRDQDPPATSSYDQVAPVLLGQQSFPGHDGQGQGR